MLKDDAKPPVLKRYALKSNQSEVFYNSKSAINSNRNDYNNNNNNKLLPNAHNKNISKSYGNELDNRGAVPLLQFGADKKECALKDSLKIYHLKKCATPSIAAEKQSSQEQQQRQQSDSRDSIENNSASSSSMSSVASSNEDEQDKSDHLEERLKKR